MKLLNFKAIAALALGAILFASCEKAVTYDPIGSQGQQIIKFVKYGGYSTNFANSNLAFNSASTSEMLPLNLELDAESVLDVDITCVVGVDAAALATYNATQTDPTKRYLLLPGTAYTFPDKTVKIKAGQSISEAFSIEFNPSMIDGSKNLMLPITIKSITGAPGAIVKSPQTSTVYFHFIGNYLAGNYSWRYRRWQSDDTTTVPLQDIVTTSSLAALAATKLMTRETYTETFVDPGKGLVLDFAENGGVLSNFSLSLLPSTLTGISAGGFILVGGPKFTGTGFNLVGTAATNFIGTNFSTFIGYQNSSGGFRTLVNSFVKIP